GRVRPRTLGARGPRGGAAGRARRARGRVLGEGQVGADQAQGERGGATGGGNGDRTAGRSSHGSSLIADGAPQTGRDPCQDPVLNPSVNWQVPAQTISSRPGCGRPASRSQAASWLARTAGSGTRNCQ